MKELKVDMVRLAKLLYPNNKYCQYVEDETYDVEYYMQNASYYRKKDEGLKALTEQQYELLENFLSDDYYSFSQEVLDGWVEEDFQKWKKGEECENDWDEWEEDYPELKNHEHYYDYEDFMGEYDHSWTSYVAYEVDTLCDFLGDVLSNINESLENIEKDFDNKVYKIVFKLIDDGVDVDRAEEIAVHLVFKTELELNEEEEILVAKYCLSA